MGKINKEKRQGEKETNKESKKERKKKERKKERGRAPWPCGLIHHVLDREEDG